MTDNHPSETLWRPKVIMMDPADLKAVMLAKRFYDVPTREPHLATPEYEAARRDYLPDFLSWINERCDPPATNENHAITFVDTWLDMLRHIGS